MIERDFRIFLAYSLLQHVRNGIYYTEQERDGFDDIMFFISKREKPEILVSHLGVNVEDYNLKSLFLA